MKRKVRRSKGPAEAPNRFRGEFGVTVGGKTYTFRFGINTLVALEQRLGCATIYELMARLQPSRLSFRDLRVLLQAGLAKHHPSVEEDFVGELIDELGGIDGALERVLQALQASFPDVDPGEIDADPNAARAAGSGAAS